LVQETFSFTRVGSLSALAALLFALVPVVGLGVPFWAEGAVFMPVL
jgi:hypothetical protein